VNVQDLIRTVSQHPAANAGRMEKVAHELRRIGALPKGGRGPHAPAIDTLQAAVLLITFAGADRIEDVVPTLDNALRLVDVDGVKLAGMLAHALSDQASLASIYHITLYPMGTMADLILQKGGKPANLIRFLLPDQWQADANPYAQNQILVGRTGHIGGGILEVIALKMGTAEVAA
jgi:hypothetical protein